VYACLNSRCGAGGGRDDLCLVSREEDPKQLRAIGIVEGASK
jgi:hypothetical protein